MSVIFKHSTCIKMILKHFSVVFVSLLLLSTEMICWFVLRGGFHHGSPQKTLDYCPYQTGGRCSRCRKKSFYIKTCSESVKTDVSALHYSDQLIPKSPFTTFTHSQSHKPTPVAGTTIIGATCSLEQVTITSYSYTPRLMPSR